MKGSTTIIIVALIVAVVLLGPTLLNAVSNVVTGVSNSVSNFINNGIGTSITGSSTLNASLMLFYQDGGHMLVASSSHQLLPLTIKDTHGKVASLQYDLSATILSSETPTQVSLTGQNLVLVYATDSLGQICQDSLSGTSSAANTLSEEVLIHFGPKTIQMAAVESFLTSKGLSSGHYALHWDATVSATVTFADGKSDTQSGGGSSIMIWEFDWDNGVISFSIIVSTIPIR